MPVVCLRVVAGPDLGREITVHGAPVRVGRGEGETLRLSDGAVSRHHLTVRCDDRGRIVVEEIAGVNPVWTLDQGQTVTLTRGHVLGRGGTLTLGNTTLQVREVDAAPGTAPEPSGTLEIDAQLLTEPAPPSRLAALAALAERLARCGSLQALFREATAWAVHALPASRTLLLSAEGHDILAAAADGVVGDLAISRALLDRVRQERRAFLVRDVLAEPDLADRHSVQLRGIAGAMAAPAHQLVLYAEWGIQEASQGRHDEESLLLLLCAAHLIAALADTAGERSQLQAAVSSRPAIEPPGHRMIGRSAAMERLQVFLERVAPTPATVLLRGESGTGKELAARLVHGLSTVAKGPFVAINCAAIPEALLESELFGHEKGAFTGAVTQHDGVFTRADQGTLFLDEIGEMSPGAQARMLRVLENRTFTRVGGIKEETVTVRLIAATHRDLRAMVSAGQFREDLLYRLSVLHTELPALRERVDDVPALVRHFADQLGGQIGRRIETIAPDALALLQAYRWPGNVRELRNVVERALVLGDGPVLEVDDLPPELTHCGPRPAPRDGPGASLTVASLAEVERQAIAAALRATAGNKARAAALLGIDRTTLYRKLKDHGIPN